MCSIKSKIVLGFLISSLCACGGGGGDSTDSNSSEVSLTSRGQIVGTVQTEEGEALEDAEVTVVSDNVFIQAGQTDRQGNFDIVIDNTDLPGVSVNTSTDGNQEVSVSTTSSIELVISQNGLQSSVSLPYNPSNPDELAVFIVTNQSESSIVSAEASQGSVFITPGLIQVTNSNTNLSLDSNELDINTEDTDFFLDTDDLSIQTNGVDLNLGF